MIRDDAPTRDQAPRNPLDDRAVRNPGASLCYGTKPAQDRRSGWGTHITRSGSLRYWV